MDDQNPSVFPQDLLASYRILLGEIEAWFQRGVAVHRDRVNCRPGCTLCCHGLFDISPLDSGLAAAGFQAAPEDVRKILGEAAALQLGLIRRVAPDWDAPWVLSAIGPDRFDDLCDRLGPTPCPALSPAGLCLIYDHRPLVCRLHGLPMFEARDGAHRGGECHLNIGVEEASRSPELRFDHETFESRELALIGNWAGAWALADPEGAGTILAAVLAAGRDNTFQKGDN